MKLVLRRERQQPSPDCTLGLLLIQAASLTLCTIEPPWIASPNPEDRGGLKFKSCVPLGTYRLEIHNSKKHGRTWALVNHDLDVVHYEGDDNDPDEDRSTSLLHVANFARQLQACIAPGLSHAKAPNGEHMVTSSARAMEKLRAAVPWTNGHTLEIVEGL